MKFVPLTTITAFGLAVVSLANPAFSSNPDANIPAHIIEESKNLALLNAGIQASQEFMEIEAAMEASKKTAEREAKYRQHVIDAQNEKAAAAARKAQRALEQALQDARTALRPPMEAAMDLWYQQVPHNTNYGLLNPAPHVLIPNYPVQPSENPEYSAEHGPLYPHLPGYSNHVPQPGEQEAMQEAVANNVQKSTFRKVVDASIYGAGLIARGTMTCAKGTYAAANTLWTWSKPAVFWTGRQIKWATKALANKAEPALEYAYTKLRG